MAENIVGKINPYNNEVAFKDLLKIMRRKDLITISFVVDNYGYESYEIESKIMDKFIVQHCDGMYDWINHYLISGEIHEPIPSPTNGLIKSVHGNTNSFASNLLRLFISDPKEHQHMHIVPEIVDKPDRLTVTFAYPYGVIVFKVTRSQEMRDFLESQGF